MKYETIRQQVVDALQRAAALGLIHATSGNIAVRDFADNVIAISPSNRPYDTMKAEDVAIVTLDGEWVDGPYKPSSETAMHTAVFRARPDVGATVHLHGLFSTVMAMEGEVLPVSTPPQALLAPIGIVPFELPGSEALARRVVDVLGEGSAVLLQNHGSFTCGQDMESAMTAAIYTEEAAQIAWYSKVAGNFHPLNQEQIAAVKAVLTENGAV